MSLTLAERRKTAFGEVAMRGRWYEWLGGRNVELRPVFSGGRVSWYFVGAGGIGIGQVQEEELRWTAGRIPEERTL